MATQQLSAIPLIDKAAIEARAQLLTTLKAKEATKARAAFQTLIHAIKGAPTSQATHFRQIDPFDLLPFALKELDVAEAALLFNTKKMHFTAVMLKQLRDFHRVLNTLATKLQEKKFADLNITRQEIGMQHFFADLKDPRHDRDGTGWTMRRGLLTIFPTHFQNETTQQQIHAYLNHNEQLGKKVWYEKPENTDPDLEIASTYGINIKTLGMNGKNPAVDPLFIIRGKDGEIMVLCGTRRGGYALPGGMQEAKVKETCINELLEECFSGTMFEPDSATAKKFNAIDLDDYERNESAIVTIQNHLYKGEPPKEGEYDYETKLAAHFQELKESLRIAEGLANSQAPSLSNSNYLLDVIKQIQSSNKIKDGDRASLIAHLKCEFYKTYLPTQYQRFEKMVNERMHTAELVMNKSDPRNTDLAYMCTTPVELVIDEEALTKFFENECDLIFGAGDDLEKVQYRPIDVFAKNITDNKVGAYSDHASLMIQAIQHSIARGELVIDHKLVEQIKTIAQNNLEDDPLLMQISNLSESLLEPQLAAVSLLA